jgi:hypothetical protein
VGKVKLLVENIAIHYLAILDDALELIENVL